MKKILFATTNKGKFAEFIHEVADLPFTFLSLNDVDITAEPEEPFLTTWENALAKARFYATKSGLTTFAEDTGFFVDYLNGMPGTGAKRFGINPNDCRKKVLNSLRGVRSRNRGAHFEASGCLYDPKTHGFTMFRGLVRGCITLKPQGVVPPGIIYDSIFYFPPRKKTFAAMSLSEKNLVSHRGQIINQLRVYLLRHYEIKQFIVPLAILIRNRKMLLIERRDFRPEMNNKWEFPGGGVERGETVVECLKREVKEETGFSISIQQQLRGVPSAVRRFGDDQFQVFIVVFVTTIRAGRLKTSPAESAGHGWFRLQEALKMDLFSLNKKVIRDNLVLLQTYLD